MSRSAVLDLLNELRPERLPDGRVAAHGLTGRQTAVLIAVADRMGGAGGKCTASLDTIAATMGLSRSSTKRSVAPLEALGLLSRERNGYHNPDTIRLRSLAIPKTVQADPSKPAHADPPSLKTGQADRIDGSGWTDETGQADPLSPPLKPSVKPSIVQQASERQADLVALALREGWKERAKRQPKAPDFIELPKPSAVPCAKPAKKEKKAAKARTAKPALRATA